MSNPLSLTKMAKYKIMKLIFYSWERNVVKGYLIVGGGKGGTSLLKTLSRMNKKIYAIIDRNKDAQGILEAQRLGIAYDTTYEPYLTEEVEVIIEATGNEQVYEDLLAKKKASSVLIPSTTAHIIYDLIEERQELIELISKQKNQIETIFNSTHDGMIAIDDQCKITLFNRAAEKMTGKRTEDALNNYIHDVIPTSRLHIVLQTGEMELNQEQELESGVKIISNRVPIHSQAGDIIGAVAVFRDITEVTGLTRKIIDLKDLLSLLEAIINSSNDAISVVDENGNGIMINPAYTKLIGLTEDMVIGKPAYVDISEGESMHMHVLKTGQPVRGVPLKVGSKRKDVIVNVAPVYIDGRLKGSVGIIHDTSEIKRLNADLEKAKRIIRSLEAKYAFNDIVGKSEKMLLAIKQAKQASKTTATVLLRGESGTGKELFAHAIHNNSDRHAAPFIRVNCAALSESLLESELFGYEEGAFTGAIRGGKRGLFEEASGGTIFLDEIGELTMSTQAKLLRVLQEREIVRVGSSKPIEVDVRVISATNVDLESAIVSRSFREDLYYRLNVLPIMIPPLRERSEDIEILALYLIKKINIEYGRNVEEISAEALAILKAYHWPGNVRELENIMGRSLIYMGYNEKCLLPEHLPHLGQPRNNWTNQKHSLLLENVTLESQLNAAEKAILEEVYYSNNKNKTATAKQLGISLRNLYYKMEKHQLE